MYKGSAVYLPCGPNVIFSKQTCFGILPLFGNMVENCFPFHRGFFSFAALSYGSDMVMYESHTFLCICFVEYMIDPIRCETWALTRNRKDRSTSECLNRNVFSFCGIYLNAECMKCTVAMRGTLELQVTHLSSIIHVSSHDNVSVAMSTFNPRLLFCTCSRTCSLHE